MVWYASIPILAVLMCGTLPAFTGRCTAPSTIAGFALWQELGYQCVNESRRPDCDSSDSRAW